MRVRAMLRSMLNVLMYTLSRSVYWSNSDSKVNDSKRHDAHAVDYSTAIARRYNIQTGRSRSRTYRKTCALDRNPIFKKASEPSRLFHSCHALIAPVLSTVWSLDVRILNSYNSRPRCGQTI
jgi:hypothetical protein